MPLNLRCRFLNVKKKVDEQGSCRTKNGVFEYIDNELVFRMLDGMIMPLKVDEDYYKFGENLNTIILTRNARELIYGITSTVNFYDFYEEILTTTNNTKVELRYCKVISSERVITVSRPGRPTIVINEQTVLDNLELLASINSELVHQLIQKEL